MRWAPDDVTRSVAGAYTIVFGRKGHTAKDVTYFRDVPAILESYSSGDPFGDGAAVISFPQISGFDDLSSPEFSEWLADYSSVDIYWHTPQAGTGMLSPLTQQDVYLLPVGLSQTGRTKVWEGFVASFEIVSGDGDSSLQVQCQGALYQLDRYLQKPFFPPRPWPMEKLIADTFSKVAKPHLRTGSFKINWPVGWTKLVPAYTAANAYTPQATPGTKYTGYSSRQTGGWDHTLTGFVQDLLAVMWTDDESGVTPGNQWTLRKRPGRIPVLEVRDRFREADFELWYGTPGVSIRVTRDTTQAANIIYASGTGIDGVTWRNAVISSDGSRTDYLPLAADKAIYPKDQTFFNPDAFASEAFINYGSGMQMDQAIESTSKKLLRDRDPGYAGTMVLNIDPEGLLRYQIEAGMTVKIKGFAGTGETGMNFHLAEVNVDVQSMSVSVKIDTRYRDLLTLEEAQQRTIDPLTPTKLLQVNRRSVMLEDVMAPWDYSAGSGFIPKGAKRYHNNRPNTTAFPWASWLLAHPPRTHAGSFVRVRAYRDRSRERWTLGKDVPILTAQKGTIRRIEIVACDIDGNILEIPFHFSLYYHPVTISAMPHQGTNYSPFQTGAFESTSPTGEPWPAGNFFAPDPSMVIGWGNALQRAGHSPGLYSEGYPATGLLVDDSTWNFDNMNNPDFDKNAVPGARQPASAVTLYGAFYASTNKSVYFTGRMYRAEPGT